jgi:DNA-binding response OmpR family regulator
MKKILIVDDEPDFVEMVTMRLEANGYDVISANDGASGLACAKTEAPNLILLDVMMPGMDGFEVLRQLSRDPATRAIPVIMLTAKGESRSIFRAQEMGATDYLIKPMNSEQMLKMLARHA